MQISEPIEGFSIGNVIEVVLTQEDVRYTQASRDSYPINLTVFKWISSEPLTTRQQSLDASHVQLLATTGGHAVLRSVSSSLIGLDQGTYLLVPSTFDPDCECLFHLVLHSGTSDPILRELQ